MWQINIIIIVSHTLIKFLKISKEIITYILNRNCHKEYISIISTNLRPAPKTPAKKTPDNPGKCLALDTYVTKAGKSLSSTRGTPPGSQPPCTHVAQAARPHHTHREIARIAPKQKMNMALENSVMVKLYSLTNLRQRDDSRGELIYYYPYSSRGYYNSSRYF